MKRKTMISLALAFLMTTSVAFASKKEQALKCNFRDIKIKKNGQMLNVTREPFIYDGTTFLPLRDVSEGLGLTVGWDDVTSTISLSGGSSSDTETLQHDLRNKDVMIQQLQNQINFLKDENDKLKKELKDEKDKEDEDEDDDDDVKDLKNDLEKDYEEYTKGKKKLEFDFSLDNGKSEVEIEMEGDFKRSDSEWNDRDEDKFQDFIEDIAKKAAKELDKDVEITVKDEDDDKCGEYTYDEGKKSFKVKEEYGSKSSSDDDDVKDLKDDLKDDYEEYTKGKKKLEFDFDLKDGKSEIEIEMEGDFKRSDSEWKDRDEDKFQDYIKDIAEKATKELDKDVEITVKDEDGDKCGEYTYDEGKKSFKVKEEYGSKSSSSDVKDEIEKMLKDDYDEYDKGKKDLEFKYNVKVKDDEVEVTMILQDYEEKDTAWKDRDDDEFEDFMEDIAKDIAKIKKDTDVSIKVYSEKDDDNKIESKSFDAKDID